MGIKLLFYLDKEISTSKTTLEQIQLQKECEQVTQQLVMKGKEYIGLSKEIKKKNEEEP